jgi:hypothetical protein
MVLATTPSVIRAHRISIAYSGVLSVALNITT